MTEEWLVEAGLSPTTRGMAFVYRDGEPPFGEGGISCQGHCATISGRRGFWCWGCLVEGHTKEDAEISGGRSPTEEGKIATRKTYTSLAARGSTAPGSFGATPQGEALGSAKGKGVVGPSSGDPSRRPSKRPRLMRDLCRV
ncbi:hypothetical protein C4D60_Mb03t17770 [Musa balbisiana]|uniref:Uncharacterized protein n=1 Tax=Musa balbisiana TaxID=52838 RepID=A0A4S8JAL6_MUSBA|nr:hypothetical protein C4D60_Mb03t17770 [Musa balbisiana]